MEYPDYLAVLLLIIALALLAAEFFIPSGGIILVIALVCVTASVIFAWHAWWDDHPGYWWTYIAVLVLSVPVTAGFALYALQRTRLGRRILLDAPPPEEIAPYAREQQRLAQLVGKTGKAVTLLSPGGLVLVEGERMHCESQGILIDPGEEVDVVAVKGNRLVVRPAVHRPKSEEVFLGENEEQDEPPLDFELPRD
jgi:membrane-bound ClpP family serine protease